MNSRRTRISDPFTVGEVHSKFLDWYRTTCSRNVDDSDQAKFDRYFAPFRTDLVLVSEYPYTDKVYRDSYYHFHASKYQDIPRDTMRVFFFEPDFPVNQIPETPELLEKIQKAFLGFVVLRPLVECPFGRAMISPRALIDREFVTCLSTAHASFLGAKLSVSAFPHESQDAQTHSCAETAIWSIFEYYGNQYSEHRPVLPSEIIRALQPSAPRRLLPSNGLSILEIARALQHLGHGTQTYSRAVMNDDKQFFRYLHYLVESGIPTILGLELVSDDEKKKDGHAVVATGHRAKLGLPLPKGKKLNSTLSLVDTADFDVDLISSDDNLSPYTRLPTGNPSLNYAGQGYGPKSRISHFVVPLHRHMHMDVKEASDLFQQVLENKSSGLPRFYPKGIAVVRIFLTGSRSWKESILQDSAIERNLKTFVIATALPRFVWICELSDRKNYLMQKATGFVVLDATGSARDASVVISMMAGMLKVEQNDGSTKYFRAQTAPFGQYQNNLKGKWSHWGMK